MSTLDMKQTKGPVINFNIFMGVQTIHIGRWGGRGIVKINFYLYTFNFLAWFLLFAWGFYAIKNVDVYAFFDRGGSQRVYGLYIHENVAIYGQPLMVCWFQILYSMSIKYNT